MFRNMPINSPRYRGFVLPARVNGHDVPSLALFDSGADVSLIAEEVIDSLPDAVQAKVMDTLDTSRATNIVTASNDHMDIKGMVSLKLLIGRQKEPVTLDAHVVPGLVPPIILGHKALAAMNAQLRFTQGADSYLVICDEKDDQNLPPSSNPKACTMYKMSDVLREFQQQQSLRKAATAYRVNAVSSHAKDPTKALLQRASNVAVPQFYVNRPMVMQEHKRTPERQSFDTYNPNAVGFHRMKPTPSPF
jgi:hypothetical protein